MGSPQFNLTYTDADKRRFDKFLRRAEGGCLIWIGPRTRGYGSFWLRGRSVRAHRLAWVMAGNFLTPERPCVLHRCDNPACCEPSHLWAGTQADNAADCSRKRRTVKSRSGLPFGVIRRPDRGCPVWVAKAWNGVKTAHLGTYPTMGAAAEAAEAARLHKQEI